MKKIIGLFCVFNIILSTTPCFADMIELKDGTVLKGQIQKEEGTSIFIKTDSGVQKADLSAIKKIDLDAEKIKAAVTDVPANVPKDKSDEFEKSKLSIKTVEVLDQYVERTGYRYYGWHHHHDTTYIITTEARKEWEILKGGTRITDLEFIRLIDPPEASKLELDLNTRIKDDNNATLWFSVSGVTGCAAMLVSAIPFQENTDSSTGQKFYTYNQGNSLLLAGGAILFIIGVFGATGANADASSLQSMKTDPFFHFNDLKYTEGKINDFNNKLKLTLGINF